MTKILPPTYVRTLLGAGDAIVLKPLMRLLSQQYQRLYWPCRSFNLHTMQALFGDLVNVEPMVIDDSSQEQQWLNTKQVPVLNLVDIIQEQKIWYQGWSQSCPVAVNYERQIYEYFDIPYSRRYQLWSAQFDHAAGEALAKKLNPTGEPYVLWHNSTSYRAQGADINLNEWRHLHGLPQLKIIKVEPITDNLLDWFRLIEAAREIHCISSSFHCLVDSLWNKTKADLYYHDVRHNARLQVNCNSNGRRWNIVNYQYKI